MKPTQIIESFVTKGQILEQASKNDAILCRAKYQICSIGEKNRNNRVYEKAVWDKVLADPDITAKLENKSLFFHAEHPTTTQSNTEKVAGVVTDMVLNEDENKVYAVMEVLDTPYGRIVDTLLRAGCGIGVSTRADGELEEAVDESGGKYQRVVPESYRFVTIDFTADPSTFGSELPLTVERDVTRVIKTGLDDNKIDRQYATVLLEKLYSPEAVALLESLRAEDIGDKKTVKEEITKLPSVRGVGSIMANLSSEENLRTVRDALYDQHLSDDRIDFILNDLEDSGNQDMIRKALRKYLSERWLREANKKRSKKYASTSDLCDQPADAKAAQVVVKNSSSRNKKTNNASHSVNKKNVKETTTVELSKIKEKQIENKANQFLSDNWDSFSSPADAVQSVMRVFKLGENDAKQYVDGISQNKGTISAVTTRSDEKVIPSGIEKDLAEMSERLVSLTAERDQLVENYGKDVTSSTIKIKELNKQLKEQAGIVESLKKESVQLTDNLEKANETIKTVKESHKVDLKSLQETKEEEGKKIEEKHEKEMQLLKEEHKKNMISFYVSTKTKSMGLHLPESVLTLLESCNSVKEVDAMIRRTQNALRENIVQSANGLSEIVMESQSDPNPVVTDIRNKVGLALKHFGV